MLYWVDESKLQVQVEGGKAAKVNGLADEWLIWGSSKGMKKDLAVQQFQKHQG